MHDSTTEISWGGVRGLVADFYLELGKSRSVCRLFSLIFVLFRVSKIKKVLLGHRKITGFSQEKQ